MDVVKIVDKLASLELIRVHKISGDWYQCYCPFHNDGNEKKPSFGILLHDQYRNGMKYPAGFGHCFSCSYAGDLSDMLSKILQSRSIPKSGAEWLSENVEGYDADNDFESLLPPEILQSTMNKFAIAQLSNLAGSTTSFVSDEELASYRYTVPYMYERKLTDEVIAMYDVGVDMKWTPEGRKNPVPCITFPVHDKQGRTLFICRRSISGKLYNYPSGVSKPLYGIDKIPQGCKSLVICESCINALTSVVYGHPAVALLGTGNPYQISQLRQLGVPEFVICTDGDDAGRRAASKLKRALKDIALIWIINMPDGKDLNDCSKEEFEQLYAMRE